MRPQVLHGKTYRCPTACGNLYITVNSNETDPAEVFCCLGKAGTCAAAFMRALATLCSIAFEHGAPVAEITEALAGISCRNGDEQTPTCINQIAHTLRRHQTEMAIMQG